MKNLFPLVVGMLFAINLQGQSTASNIKIFLDCQWGCDTQYFTQELKYVDFMRDRQDSEALYNSSVSNPAMEEPSSHFRLLDRATTLAY